MPDRTPPLPADDAQFLLLCALYLDGHLNADQLAQFKAALLASADRRRLFVDMCLLQTRLNEEFGVAGTDVIAGMNDRPDILNPSDEPGGHEMDDTMILPAIHESDALGASVDEPDVAADFPGGDAPSNTSSPKSRRWRWSGFKAAAIILIPLIAAYIAWTIWPRPDPASITATAGAIAERTDVAPGKHFARGQRLQLDSGSIEITFDSGAKVLLRGPASMTIDGRNAMTLSSGAITAYAPSSATGFQVIAPGLSVVDLGTKFGVRCAADGSGSEVQIFQGSVNATLLDSTAHALGSATRLIAGQAIEHDSHMVNPVAVKFAPESFDRDIDAIRESVATVGTGIQATPDGLDVQWQLLSAPDDPDWKPRGALILDSPYPTYEANDSAAKWITKEGIGRVPSGPYVYRTHIDLSGFNPASVAVSARVAADNYLKDILVNGVSTGASTPAIKLQEFPCTVVKIPSTAAWRAGINEVDVVVMNTDFQTPDLASPTGLKLSWTVTASPIVNR